MPDPALDDVETFLNTKPDLAGCLGAALRQAFDEIIDCERTGRFRVEQLEKTEKTYIGTKIEILIRNALGLPRGNVLDNLIAGHEVDTKYSLTGGWMIPNEARGEICLLIEGNDNSGTLSAGLLRMTPEVLTPGKNQDGKGSVSSVGKKNIRWLVRNSQIPRNFLLDLDDTMRAAILGPSAAKHRIQALFRNVTGKVIPRTAIQQVGRSRDSLKRAREAKAALAPEGYEVLCATYLADREQMARYGVKEPKGDDWISVQGNKDTDHGA